MESNGSGAVPTADLLAMQPALMEEVHNLSHHSQNNHSPHELQMPASSLSLSTPQSIDSLLADFSAVELALQPNRYYSSSEPAHGDLDDVAMVLAAAAAAAAAAQSSAPSQPTSARGDAAATDGHFLSPYEPDTEVPVVVHMPTSNVNQKSPTPVSARDHIDNGEIEFEPLSGEQRDSPKPRARERLYDKQSLAVPDPKAADHQDQPRNHYTSKDLPVAGAVAVGVASDGGEPQKLMRIHRVIKAEQMHEGTLLPENAWSVRWLVIMLIMIGVNTWSVPFRLSVGYEHIDGVFDAWVISDIICDFVYIINIFVKLRTAFYHEGKLITDPIAIRKRYLWSFNMFIDICSLFPLDWFLLIGGQPTAGLFWRLNRLAQITYVQRLITALETSPGVNISVVRLSKVLILYLLLGHIIGCAWFGSALPDSFGDAKDSWKPYHTILNKSYIGQYVSSLYWGLSFMSDRSEPNVPEVIGDAVFLLSIQIIGVIMLSYLVGNVGSLIEERTYADNIYRLQLDYVTRFMQQAKLPKALQQKIFNYYTYNWSLNRGFDDFQMLKDLPPSLRTDVVLCLTEASVHRNPLFSGLDPAFLAALVKTLSQRTLVPGEFLCQKGDSGDEMYFLRGGSIEILIEGNHIRTALEGESIGEFALLLGTKRTASVRALTYCDLFVLNKNDLADTLSFYPDVQSELESRAIVRRDELHKKELLVAAAGFGVVTMGASGSSRSLRNIQLSRRGSLMFGVPVNEPKGFAKIKADVKYWFDENWVEGRAATEWWARVIFLATVWNCLVVPFRVVFCFNCSQPGLLAIDYILDSFLLINIGSNLIIRRPPAFGSVGHLETYAECRLRYLHSWYFIFDIFTCFPWDFIMLGVGMNPIVRAPRVLRIFVDFHVVSVRRLQAAGVNISVVGLLQLAMSVGLLGHWFACAYWSWGFWVDYSSETGQEVVWLPPKVWKEEGLSASYLWALTYSFTILIGLGRKTPPDGTAETIFVIISIMLGIFIVAWAIGEVGDLIGNLDRFTTEFGRLIQNTNEFMEHRNIPEPLRARIRTYLSHWFSARHGVEPSVAMEGLPVGLKGEIMQHLCNHLLVKVPFFKMTMEADSHFSKHIVERLTFESYPEGEFIFHAGEVADCMYFITDGEVGIYLNEDDEKPVKIIGIGSFFGEVSLLSAGLRTASMRAISPCHLMVLSKTDFVEIMEFHPHFAEGIRHIASHRSYRMRHRRAKAFSVSESGLHPSMLKTAELSLLPEHSVRDEEKGDAGERRRIGSISVKYNALDVPSPHPIEPESPNIDSVIRSNHIEYSSVNRAGASPQTNQEHREFSRVHAGGQTPVEKERGSPVMHSTFSTVQTLGNPKPAHKRRQPSFSADESFNLAAGPVAHVDEANKENGVDLHDSKPNGSKHHLRPSLTIHASPQSTQPVHALPSSESGEPHSARLSDNQNKPTLNGTVLPPLHPNTTSSKDISKQQASPQAPPQTPPAFHGDTSAAPVSSSPALRSYSPVPASPSPAPVSSNPVVASTSSPDVSSNNFSAQSYNNRQESKTSSTPTVIILTPPSSEQSNKESQSIVVAKAAPTNSSQSQAHHDVQSREPVANQSHASSTTQSHAPAPVVAAHVRTTSTAINSERPSTQHGFQQPALVQASAAPQTSPSSNGRRLPRIRPVGASAAGTGYNSGVNTGYHTGVNSGYDTGANTPSISIPALSQRAIAAAVEAEFARYHSRGDLSARGENEREFSLRRDDTATLDDDLEHQQHSLTVFEQAQMRSVSHMAEAAVMSGNARNQQELIDQISAALARGDYELPQLPPLPQSHQPSIDSSRNVDNYQSQQRLAQQYNALPLVNTQFNPLGRGVVEGQRRRANSPSRSRSHAHQPDEEDDLLSVDHSSRQTRSRPPIRTPGSISPRIHSGNISPRIAPGGSSTPRTSLVEPFSEPAAGAPPRVPRITPSANNSLASPPPRSNYGRQLSRASPQSSPHSFQPPPPPK